MARETTTRGRSAPPEHEARRGVGITRLRPTWRGVSVAVVALTLARSCSWSREIRLSCSCWWSWRFPWSSPLVVVLGRAHRAAGAEIHMMVTPPLVPVGAPCDLLVQLTHSGGADLPPVSLDRPSDHWSVAVTGRAAFDQNGIAARHVRPRRRDA